MHFWDGIACEDSDLKETTAEGDTSECPAEQKMSLDETLRAESKGEPEPSIDSVFIVSTTLTSSEEAVKMSEVGSGLILKGVRDGEVLQEVKQDTPDNMGVPA